MTQWDALEPKNKAWFEILVILPYDALIDIDSEGDEFFHGPILYVDNFLPDGRPPFAEGHILSLSAGEWGPQADANREMRVSIFDRPNSSRGEASGKD